MKTEPTTPLYAALCAARDAELAALRAENVSLRNQIALLKILEQTGVEALSAAESAAKIELTVKPTMEP